MSSPYVNKTKLVLRMNDNVDTGENTRRIHSEEPILQIDISNRKKIDITKKIQEKRKEIQKLYINNLGASKYWRSERKPSPLRRLEEGMIKFFFKEDSNVLNKIPKLRRALLRDEHKRKSIFSPKIDVGPLVYLYLNDNGNTQISRQIDIQSRKLKMSQNYEVFNDKDIVQTEMQRLLDKEKNATSPLNNPKIRNSRNSFRLSCLTKPNKCSDNNSKQATKYTTPNKKSSFSSYLTPTKIQIIPKMGVGSISTQEKNNLLFKTTVLFNEKVDKKHRKSQSSTMIKHHRNFPKEKVLKSIITKADTLVDHTTKIDGQLCEIIDSLQYKTKKENNNKKDLEEIYDMKINDRKNKGTTKDLVIQAVKIKDDYTLMDSDKAAMIKLSDDITKMPDEVALTFADRIVENYYAKSDKVDKFEYKSNPFVEKLRIKKQRKLRDKTDNNYDKIQRLG